MTRPEPADAQLPATYETEAAWEPEGPGDEAAYKAILSAVMETARGRWFLAEYARRNRSADTELVLQALARLEARVTQQNGEAAPAPGPAAESVQSGPDSASETSAPEAAPEMAREAVWEERGAADPSATPLPSAKGRPAAREPQEAPAPNRQLAAVTEQPRETEKAPDMPPAARRLAQLSRAERQALFS